MLRTRFTEMFDLRYPVMSAPMVMHTGAPLAAAVSAAGGLGSFGGTNPWKQPDWIKSEIALLRATTDRPFAVGFITPLMDLTAAIYEAALSEHPPAVALSFADPSRWVAEAHDAGAVVLCQVQSYDDADVAVDAGADVLVAQGTEAGGHTGTLGMLPFLVGLVSRYPHIPVLAAGGIGDGRTLAVALLAGAEGAWMSTAFLATREAVEVHDIHKRLIVESDGGDTVFTRSYDIVSGLPWPQSIGNRVRRNRFTDQWTEREAELRERRAEFVRPPDAVPFASPPKPEWDPILCGQSAGLVNEVRAAGDVVRAVGDEAEAILRSRPSQLYG
ncbi:MAG: nitronate monooxygenase [Mycobacterium sp.]|nr:nitronate monooxygenase [Mycobacterium sp.]